MKAVAVAGGWTDFDTTMRCYDIPEDTDVLAVTSETRSDVKYRLSRATRARDEETIFSPLSPVCVRQKSNSELSH